MSLLHDGLLCSVKGAMLRAGLFLMASACMLPNWALSGTVGVTYGPSV